MGTRTPWSTPEVRTLSVTLDTASATGSGSDGLSSSITVK